MAEEWILLDALKASPCTLCDVHCVEVYVLRIENVICSDGKAPGVRLVHRTDNPGINLAPVECAREGADRICSPLKSDPARISHTDEGQDADKRYEAKGGQPGVTR